MPARILPAGVLFLAACAAGAGADAARNAAPPFAGMSEVEDHDLHHLIRVSDRIWSGAAPEGGESFAALAARGIRTIVSVDGARPDVEGAGKHGIRYVHVPFGYDGVPEEAALQIVRAMEETKGAVYFHCHHGQHRGPAAAAIAMRAETGCSAEESAELMKLAKTDAKYKGLWRDVLNFRPPAKGTPRPELHEVAPVGDFAAAMAKMDREWDRMKLVQAAAWGVPAEHPDLAPAKEARILAETFAALEGALAAEQRADARFLGFLEEGRTAAAGLRDALERGDAAGAEKQFAALRKSCGACHDVYRNE